MQKYILLNVPARQSRNYYDYFRANVPSGYLIYVDALFGGLDVAARLKYSSESESEFIISTVLELIEKKGLTKEGAVLDVTPFIDETEVGIEENFILVILITDENMMDSLHQKAFTSFLERSHIMRRLRFAATVSSSISVHGIPMPLIVERHSEYFPDGKVTILEFTVDTLNDPRDIVMRNLQNFASVVSSRTFFGVNYAKEDSSNIESKAKKISGFVKNWSGPLLNWRRFFGA